MKRDDTQGCWEIRDRIPLFVGGDLDLDALDSVRTHLARCDACARYAGDASRSRQVLVTSLREREAALPRHDLWPGIREALAAEGLLRGEPARRVVPGRTRAGARPRLRLVRRVAALAAAAAVVISASLLWDRNPSVSDVVDSGAIVLSDSAGAVPEVLEHEAGVLRRVEPGEELPIDGIQRLHFHGIPQPIGPAGPGGSELAGLREYK